jgi:hypothetical protein
MLLIDYSNAAIEVNLIFNVCKLLKMLNVLFLFWRDSSAESSLFTSPPRHGGSLCNSGSPLCGKDLCAGLAALQSTLPSYL